jgi:uncharacterized protein YydD (DUF2326 family)
MKLSKLYSNQPNRFATVSFKSGLNVVLAEIRLIENRNKDTHNLGKSILGRMIDYCLLTGKSGDFFLFKHEELFEEFVFFLEIELFDSTFVTVRRGVRDATKISFKRHDAGGQDFSSLTGLQWDHAEVPFDRAKEILDGILDWRALKPWPFRKAAGYMIRSQDDYRDVFQLGSYGSKHANWKPFLAHMLGFDSKLLVEHYQKEEELSKKQTTEKSIKGELGGSVEDISKIEGMLLLKQKDADKKQKLLDEFDFRQLDKSQTKQLVEDIDERIAALNGERYTLMKNRKKIASSLEEDQILFNPEEAQRLFFEANVVFGGQIKRDFEQLIAFNKAISEERRQYLDEERAEIDARLKVVNSELTALGRRRSENLSFLCETDAFAKYKQLTGELVTIKTDIASLERQRDFLHKLQGLRGEIRTLSEQCGHVQGQIESDVEKQNADPDSLFSMIRLHFSDIVEAVIDRKALLSVAPNKEGHLEFKAEILDESGNATSADLGHTYRKLLCIAFDLAVLRAHLEVQFPRFAFHDGIFESLDDRKKENLLTVIRQYADLGLQPIITLIDCDLPLRGDKELPVFDPEEVALLLHDEGDDGRLFKMRAW